MRVRPAIFLTSDTHFGHLAMTQYQNRNIGFEEEIVKAWNSVVSKQDVVLHLGDLGTGNKVNMSRWTQRLRGRKYLVLGNHDTQTDGFYQDCGFTVIPDAHESFRDKYDVWHHFIFTHEPVWNLPPNWYNVHGHLHGNSHRGLVKEKHNHFDVGVDTVGYSPVRLFDVMNKFNVSSKPEPTLFDYIKKFFIFNR